MYDRFTDRARTCVALSRKAAEQFGNKHIEPEHLLLGVLEEGSGSAFQALERCGIVPGTVAHYLSQFMR